MADVVVTRRGVFPLFKYSLQGPRGWRATIFTDDEVGQIQIEFDCQAYFGHSWHDVARGNETFREFLARLGASYVADKFSYTLDRFDVESLVKQLRFSVKEAKASGLINRHEVEHLMELVIPEVASARSVDGYSLVMSHHIALVEKVWGGFENLPSGNGPANIRVKQFVDMMWPAFVEFLKNDGKPAPAELAKWEPGGNDA